MAAVATEGPLSPRKGRCDLLVGELGQQDGQQRDRLVRAERLALELTCGTKEMSQPCLIYLHAISLPAKVRGQFERGPRGCRRGGCSGGS